MVLNFESRDTLLKKKHNIHLLISIRTRYPSNFKNLDFCPYTLNFVFLSAVR